MIWIRFKGSVLSPKVERPLAIYVLSYYTIRYSKRNLKKRVESVLIGAWMTLKLSLEGVLQQTVRNVIT